jgi:hypothetical protein
MAVAAIAGYHYAQSADGAFAVELDVPCEGVVTITWRPNDYPGKSATIQMPYDLFAKTIRSYASEATKPKVRETG